MALWVMTLQYKLDLSTNLPHLNVHFGKRFDRFICTIHIKRKLFMTLISIILWPFKVLKVGKRFFWLRTSNGFGFIYIYIYMERNKSWNTHFIFWIKKLQTFQKHFFILNTYHLLLLTTHKIFYLLQNFLGKESTLESLYPKSSVGSQG